jgi:SHS2 domain-containing protein
VGYRLIESSSDIVVESEAHDLGGALVGLAQAFSHIVTAGSPIQARGSQRVEVSSGGSLGNLAVAFVQELIFLFDTKQFVPADGTFTVTSRGGRHVAQGTLRGETFDRARHASGTEVKAATLHDAVLAVDGQGARARVLLDL